jgi:hypothetical protein
MRGMEGETPAVVRVLTILCDLAAAPLEENERLDQARPVLTVSGLTVEDLRRALADPNLEWHQSKAQELGLPTAAWLNVVQATCVTQSRDLGDLMARLRAALERARAEAAQQPPQP